MKQIDIVADELVAGFRSRPTVRAGSLITTVFGDSIAPRGGTVWLGSLITAMADFDISERLVRTSVFRLARDGWLQSEQQGRRSYYSLTDDGKERFRSATHRIYGRPAAHWDGSWCLLLLSRLNAVTRDLVRRECGWLGFGAVSTSVLAHPAPDRNDLEATLRRLGVAADVIVLTGHTVHSDEPMRQLAHESWNLGDLDLRYRWFVEQFRPALDAAQKLDGDITPRTAFRVRTLMIQEYRKVLLRDPKMPHELLPAPWHGTEAYELCRDLYLRLHRACDQYVTETLETVDGSLPEPDDEYRSRFGGLEEAA